MFMCHRKEASIRDWPAAFAHAKYLPYIEDTSVIFRHQSHIEFFLNMLIVNTNLSVLRMRLSRKIR